MERNLRAIDPETYTASIPMELAQSCGLRRPKTVSYVSVHVIGDVACRQVAQERSTDFVSEIVTTTIHIPNGEDRFGERLRNWKRVLKF